MFRFCQREVNIAGFMMHDVTQAISMNGGVLFSTHNILSSLLSHTGVLFLLHTYTV
jgi:hypothetical protein